MAPVKIDATTSAVAHHIVDGPFTFPYAIDAHSAVMRFPGEWSFDPWPVADVAAARSSAGQPELVLTPEEQAAIDAHAKAVAEANDRLKAFREKQAEDKRIADQVAEDEALVKSAPPLPDPNRPRPPTPAQIRKNAATLSPGEQKIVDDRAAAEKKAADDKAVADKAEQDRLAAANVTRTT